MDNHTPKPNDTTPCDPPESVSELPIRAGQAAYSMIAALANLTAAVVKVEQVAMACARALDESSGAL